MYIFIRIKKMELIGVVIVFKNIFYFKKYIINIAYKKILKKIKIKKFTKTYQNFNGQRRLERYPTNYRSSNAYTMN
jgi:hypothetical protein